MEPKNLFELTDQELLLQAKKLKTARTLDAFFIGFLVGVILYSVVKNSWGLLTLIPLYLIYKLAKKPKYRQQEIETLLKERGLK